MKTLLVEILLTCFVAVIPPQPSKPAERAVIVKLHSDGHWYPVSETDWQWSGRLDGFKPARPMSVDDPSTWPKILNF